MPGAVAADASERPVWFSVLGDCHIYRDGEAIEPGGSRPVAVLVMLLLDAGRVVSTGRLIEGLWGDEPPAGAANTLQVFISRLRAALGDRSRVPAERFVRRVGSGYAIQIERDQVDLLRAEHLIARAESDHARGEDARALGEFVEALALWHGEPLTDVASFPFAAAEMARIDELRAAAEIGRLRALVALERAAEAIPDLRRITERRPSREAAVELLMTALYKSGRQADALSVYETHRRRLMEELGLAPSPELRVLQRAILAQHPALGAPRPSPGLETDGHRASNRRGTRHRWANGPAILVFVAVVAASIGGVISADLRQPAITPTGGARHIRGGRQLLLTLRADERMLGTARANLDTAKEMLEWATRHYPVQFHLAVRALARISADQTRWSMDPGRVRRDLVAADAVDQVGVPYTWGGATPRRGFDCSGLVSWAWARHGVGLPHNAAQQYGFTLGEGTLVDRGPMIDYRSLQIGDFVFSDGLGHVSIYVGDGDVVDASHTGTFIRILRLAGSPLGNGYVAATRL
jgi:DNA-binding SARP family transcriptional activator